MNIAMVSEHASPLAVLGGADAGGQNVHVAELSAALVRAGHRVRVFTRRDDARAPATQVMPTGVVVELLDAGPAAFVAKDDLWPLMGAFAQQLFQRLAADPADLVHAHFWMSASAAITAAQPLGIPVVQTFHALGSEKARMQGAADSSPAIRLAEEARIIRAVDRIVATSSSEIFELCRLGADPRRLKIVPCGVDVAAFDDRATTWRRDRRFPQRVVTLSRLVERKGVADVISALVDVPATELLIAGGPAERRLFAD
ncbi:MAG: glycosyltransferase, partial [Candidatus Eremiobacteraeota bacterium]|nr:glycosyltransferase [Candidatus Eremiobacteraeota bacterium]